MRPKPFVPELLDAALPYVRDKTEGLVWHRCTMRTLYADTDRSGAVYHATYYRYFEFGRASLMRDGDYPYTRIEQNGFAYPVISSGIEHFRPLYYDDLMCIHTRPADMGRVKLRFDYLITHAETGDIVCTGFTRHCALNSSGAPVGIDPETMRLWKAFPK